MQCLDQLHRGHAGRHPRCTPEQSHHTSSLPSHRLCASRVQWIKSEPHTRPHQAECPTQQSPEVDHPLPTAQMPRTNSTELQTTRQEKQNQGRKSNYSKTRFELAGINRNSDLHWRGGSLTIACLLRLALSHSHAAAATSLGSHRHRLGRVNLDLSCG